MKLGKLQEVDIRTVWPHEQYDFSKWLAEEEKLLIFVHISKGWTSKSRITILN